MRVLICQPFFDGAGHYAKHTFRTCQALAGLGLEVVLCTNTFFSDEYLNQPPAFRVVSLGSRFSFWPYDEAKSKSKLRWLFGRVRNNATVLLRAAKQAREERYDIVHLWNYELVSTGILHKLGWLKTLSPLIMGIEAPNFSSEYYYGGTFERIWRRAQGVAIRHLLRSWIHAISTISNSHAQKLREQLGLTKEFVVGVSGDCRDIPDKRGDKTEARKAIGLDGFQGSVFLFFGTIRRDKGLEILLRAIREFPTGDCRFVVAGYPLDWDLPRELGEINDSRLMCRFEYVPESEVENYFFASDALILPYSEYYIGSSGPLYEACARGLPVVVSEVSEMGVLTRQENLGIVVRPGDHKALVKGMVRMMDASDSERSAWSQNGLRLARAHGRRAVAKNFVALYQEVLTAEGRNM